MAIAMDIPPHGPAYFTDQGQWRTENATLTAILDGLKELQSLDPTYTPDEDGALIEAVKRLYPQARVIRRDGPEPTVEGRVY